jgi:7,8-dihydropterin-6-yl-methyl-4-(beta-D-ribofuranosyl)aminobenzene 5'-phosphate synthase
MMSLKEVDKIEITTVIDNSIDLLMAGGPNLRRSGLSPGDWLGRKSLIAEHGFSAFVRASTADHTEAMLFDAGLSENGTAHNLDVLEIKSSDIHAIVLSHGHADHTTGLVGMFDRLGKRRMPLLLHPDAFLQRKVVLPDRHEIALPPPDRSVLVREGIEVIEQRAPSFLLGGMLLVSGQIHRSTDFETGFSIHYAKIADQWQADPLIHDDQAAILNLRGQGLVILTGCGHAGVINTVRHAQTVTGVNRVHAIIGGLHLTGALFEPRIAPTVAALKEIAPTIIVPGHCTGWRAIYAIARELPDAFIPSSTGTTLTMTAQAAA